MNRLLIFLISIVIFIPLVSCGSTPAEEPVQINAAASVPQEPEQEEESFDPDNVSVDYYTVTITEVRQFMEQLNEIIRRSDYNGWVAALSPEYFAEISSPENLRRLSETPGMTTRRITLRTAEDYFTHVVVPSRANSRIDDIEFISRYRVKAFTININRAGEEQWLRLYDLEKIDGKWFIIN